MMPPQSVLNTYTIILFYMYVELGLLLGGKGVTTV
jgi:hypothetical protein